jgi:predicted house-cleaning noncanonical NTP pyrophosphatase (MazG superfamily)
MNLRNEILKELLKISSRKILLKEGAGRSFFELIFDLDKVAKMAARSVVSAADTELGGALRSLYGSLSDTARKLSEAEKKILSNLLISLPNAEKVTKADLENAVSIKLFGKTKENLKPTELIGLSNLDPRKLPKPTKQVVKTIAQQAVEFVDNNLPIIITDVGKEFSSIEKTASSANEFRKNIDDLIKKKLLAHGATEDILDYSTDLIKDKFRQRIENSAKEIATKIAQDIEKAAKAGQKNPVKEIAQRYFLGIKNGEFVAGNRFMIAGVLSALSSNEIIGILPFDASTKERINKVASTLGVLANPLVPVITWTVLKTALGKSGSSGSQGGQAQGGRSRGPNLKGRSASGKQEPPKGASGLGSDDK